MDNIIGGLFVLIFFAVWLAAIVFWIMTIVEVVKIPDTQFKAGGTDKIVWVLVVILLGVIGALVWRFVKRNDVLAAAGSMPMGGMGGMGGGGMGGGTMGGGTQGNIGGGAPSGPAAGWYPDPSGGAGQRYWDGARWTEDRR